MPDVNDDTTHSAGATEKPKTPVSRKDYTLKKDIKQAGKLLSANNGDKASLTDAQAARLKESGHI